MLYLAGYRNMVILDEGIPGWVAKQYPTATTPQRKTTGGRG
jgi:3-mercaptopyruvate sulfurtransferase SseA